MMKVLIPIVVLFALFYVVWMTIVLLKRTKKNKSDHK